MKKDRFLRSCSFLSSPSSPLSGALNYNLFYQPAQINKIQCSSCYLIQFEYRIFAEEYVTSAGSTYYNYHNRYHSSKIRHSARLSTFSPVLQTRSAQHSTGTHSRLYFYFFGPSLGGSASGCAKTKSLGRAAGDVGSRPFRPSQDDAVGREGAPWGGCEDCGVPCICMDCEAGEI